ncbi:MAG: aspartyl protease family protein [Hyphomonas sp.]
MKLQIATLLLMAAPLYAMAETPDLMTALEASDIAALEDLGMAETPEGRIARGVLAALRLEDDAALSDLALAVEDDALPADFRRAAWGGAAGVYLRQGRFAEAAAAFEAADAAAPETDEARARSTAQAYEFARTAAGAEPMQAAVADAGEAAITRDLAGLPRADALINGALQEAVLDTGANYSTIMASVAESLGVRLLEGDISVGASGNEAVAGHIGIADTLSFAGAELTDVVFIVLPDESLSFAGGVYTIPAIIGLPVFATLGRVSFEREGEDEWLRHTASDAGWSDTSNLVFRGLSPIALVEANGHPVRMFIDSGATTSHLTPLAAVQYPALLSDAVTGSTEIGGAGGARVFEDISVIPSLAVTVAGTRIELENVDVLADSVDGRHGLIGQDILNATGGYVIDFGARRFELLPPDGASTE